MPPIPVIAPHATESDSTARQGLHVSRMSSSSQESTGSSLLVTSPLLKMHEQDKTRGSPSVEELVADDDDASLKNVSKKQWQNPLITGPRPIAAPISKDDDPNGLKSQASIRSNIARYSVESQSSHRLSTSSTASSFSQRNRLSISRIGLADQVWISRVSSNNSLGSCSSVRKVTTPRKASRVSSVSASGSPAQRRKTTVLRDIPGSSMPSRHSSDATEDSGRSSNGNPFQWDQPLQKPSAMKGSPTAKKGHKRQNCVRISTLTPQILGPPSSRPTSPSIMQGIEEEPGDGGDTAASPPGVRFVSSQRHSRPPSACSFAPNLRIQTLRASLTPSSPTLSAWTAYQEHGLPSQVSDSSLSASASPGTRPISPQSRRSSNFSIQAFPSPGKVTIADVQLRQPIPEFCLSRPSTDTVEGESLSPFGLQLSLDPDMPSSPPMPVPKHDEYDPAHPAWPTVNISAPIPNEYDPASPLWHDTDPVRSSAFFPFAVNRIVQFGDDEVSPHSRPPSYGGVMPDTPPLSPKTMPDGFQAFFDKHDSGSNPPCAAEKVTSANASSIMARIPSKVDFPGAPVLPPPEEPEHYCQTTPESRQRSISNAAQIKPMRPAPPPPIPSNNKCMPSSLHIIGKTSPQGPRIQPAQSVLKNAMALRRMNSELNNTSHRESRRYFRLGREASPLLPWISSPDPSESCADMNDLFDFDIATGESGPGAEEHRSALDEIDMTQVEKTIDGALAGFEAIPSDDTTQQRGGSSVWEDGERYWEEQQSPSNPLPIDLTPRKGEVSDRELMARPLSIQATPKSLYDSDGFLRT